MADIRVIKRRIKTVQSTAKITKAMEMIATSKMRRAQENVLAGRPYAEKMKEVLANLAARVEIDEKSHPLLQRRETRKICVIHITSDRGLCGGLNANMNRMTANFILSQTLPVTVSTVGRRGRDFMARYKRDICAEFTGIGDRPSIISTTPICRIVIDDYINGVVDQVYLAYTRFYSTMIQRPIMDLLLPITPAKAQPGHALIDYIYEPNSRDVLADILPRFVEVEVYHAILESIASEQSARMVAMRNATDNAFELIDELTLMFNKARQESITKELLDIVGGTTALK